LKASFLESTTTDPDERDDELVAILESIRSGESEAATELHKRFCGPAGSPGEHPN